MGRILAVFSLLAALLSACVDADLRPSLEGGAATRESTISSIQEGGGVPGSQGGNPTVDDFERKHPAEFCQKLFDCCSVSFAERYFSASPPIRDVASCERKMRELGSVEGASVETSVAKGRAVYDGAAAAHCLATIGNASCDAFQRQFALDGTAANLLSCPGAVTGTLPLGAQCAGSQECASAYCEYPLTPSGQSHCAEKPKLGEACPLSVCAPGLYCWDRDCHAQKQDGAACSYDLECLSGGCNPSGAVRVCGVLVCK